MLHDHHLMIRIPNDLAQFNIDRVLNLGRIFNNTEDDKHDIGHEEINNNDNGSERDVAILDNPKQDITVDDKNVEKISEAIPNVRKIVKVKGNLKKNSSNTSSNIEKETSELERENEKRRFCKPLTFEELKIQLKAHIDDYRKLTVPVGIKAHPKLYASHQKQLNNQAIQNIEATVLLSLLDTVNQNISRALHLLHSH